MLLFFNTLKSMPGSIMIFVLLSFSFFSGLQLFIATLDTLLHYLRKKIRETETPLKYRAPWAPLIGSQGLLCIYMMYVFQQIRAVAHLSYSGILENTLSCSFIFISMTKHSVKISQDVSTCMLLLTNGSKSPGL